MIQQYKKHFKVEKQQITKVWPQENTDINNHKHLVIDIVTSQAFTSVYKYINPYK